MKNFFTWIGHGIVMSLILTIPTLLSVHPAWLDITIGGALNSLYLYLIAKWGNPNPSPNTNLGFTFKRRY